MRVPCSSSDQDIHDGSLELRSAGPEVIRLVVARLGLGEHSTIGQRHEVGPRLEMLGAVLAPHPREMMSEPGAIDVELRRAIAHARPLDRQRRCRAGVEPHRGNHRVFVVAVARREPRHRLAVGRQSQRGVVHLVIGGIGPTSGNDAQGARVEHCRAQQVEPGFAERLPVQPSASAILRCAVVLAAPVSSLQDGPSSRHGGSAVTVGPVAVILTMTTRRRLIARAMPAAPRTRRPARGRHRDRARCGPDGGRQTNHTLTGPPSRRCETHR